MTAPIAEGQAKDQAKLLNPDNPADYYVSKSAQKKIDRAELEGLAKVLFTSFPRFAKHCLKIQTTSGDLIPFEFNETQVLLEEIIAQIKAAGRPIRVVILKARKFGVSTYFEGRFYFLTTTNLNRYAVCVTHEPEATDTLFNMTKRFYDYCPTKLKPGLKYNNKKLLQYADIGGAFRVATAGKEDFGSAQTVHYVHLSEVSKFPSNTQKSLLTSLLQAVPREFNTEVVLESTAKGIGGEFYDRFYSSRYQYTVRLEGGQLKIHMTINEKAPKENEYASIFFPWFIFKKYRAPVADDFKRTDAEQALVDLHGVDDEQLSWRRRTIENECNGDVNTFNQEYPDTHTVAFLASGRPVFDSMKIHALMKAAPAPIARYECQVSSGQWMTTLDGPLRVWAEPVPGAAYVIGADVSEGLLHGDYSVADVIDRRTGRQVAQWHGKIDPDQFGQILFHLGTRYNIAFVAPERNNHGLATVDALVRMGYTNIYVEMIPEPPGRPRRRYGWLTTRTSKDLILDGLVQLVREGSGAGIVCAETFSEMLTFKITDNGSREAEVGMCDDRVMSLSIARHVARNPLTAVVPGPVSVNPGASPAIPAAAWT